MIIRPQNLPPVTTRVGLAWLSHTPDPHSMDPDLLTLSESISAIICSSPTSPYETRHFKAAVRSALHAGADPEAVVAESAHWPIIYRSCRRNPRRTRWILARLRLKPRFISRFLTSNFDPEAILLVLELTNSWNHVLHSLVDFDPDPTEGSLYNLHPSISINGRSIARALVVQCPSTGRQHILMVPSNIKTAREARRWTFHNHSPLIET